jgi:hypothetical protein
VVYDDSAAEAGAGAEAPVDLVAGPLATLEICPQYLRKAMISMSRTMEKASAKLVPSLQLAIVRYEQRDLIVPCTLIVFVEATRNEMLLLKVEGAH